MGYQTNNSGMHLAYVMQTHRKRLAFDYLKVDHSWSKSQVMESLRTTYFAQVHNVTTSELQRILLCQSLVIEIRNVDEVSFDDDEAQTLPARVFLTPGAHEESLTEAFTCRTMLTRGAFCDVYPGLVIAAGSPRPIPGTKVLFLRWSFDRGRAVALQLIVLTIMVVIGIAVGVAQRDVEVGAAMGGALFALTASVQVSLFWLSR